METIIQDGVNLDGFICPGHVATITGSSVFSFIPEKYGLGCVITGFEPADILMSVLMLIRQANRDKPEVEIQYSRAVSVTGNHVARRLMAEVFENCDTQWRGFGLIPLSGLMLKKEFIRFNAEYSLPVKIDDREDNEHCICGKILRGLSKPPSCPLFADICSPDNPIGACMVSNEGACNSWYKYRLKNE